MFLQITQLEGAAQQQVQELGLKHNHTQSTMSSYDKQEKVWTWQPGHVKTYSSGVSGLENVTVELCVRAAGIVGDESKLSVRGPGDGQRNPLQSVGHQKSLSG